MHSGLPGAGYDVNVVLLAGSHERPEAMQSAVLRPPTPPPLSGGLASAPPEPPSDPPDPELPESVSDPPPPSAPELRTEPEPEPESDLDPDAAPPSPGPFVHGTSGSAQPGSEARAKQACAAANHVRTRMG
jgi:hypothetical protein